jgi:L-fuconolactonase
LAAHSNVCCKLSGLVTEADWSAWKPADLRPYLDAAFGAFGHQRLLFGSDWPVCTLAASYGQVLQLIQDYLQPLSADQREAVLGGNALRFYGCQAPEPGRR